MSETNGHANARTGPGILSERSPYSLHFWLEQFQDDGNWPSVMRTAKEMLHLAPDHPEGLRFLAEAYFRLERWGEAYETATRLVRVQPCSIDGHWILSDLAAQADDLEGAADCIERAARLIPNSDAIWVEVARANFNLGRLARCVVAADHGLRTNACNVRLLIYRVFALVGLRCQRGARIAAERLLEMGVDADVLRDTARELGITNASLSRLESVARGGTPDLLARASGGRGRARRAVEGGASTVETLSASAPRLTRAQFEAALSAAQARREAADEAEEDPGVDGADPLLATAEQAYYVFDRYRVHGPFAPETLARLFAESAFDATRAYVRREAESDWVPAAEAGVLATRLALQDGADAGND